MPRAWCRVRRGLLITSDRSVTSGPRRGLSAGPRQDPGKWPAGRYAPFAAACVGSCRRSVWGDLPEAGRLMTAETLSESSPLTSRCPRLVLDQLVDHLLRNEWCSWSASHGRFRRLCRGSPRPTGRTVPRSPSQPLHGVCTRRELRRSKPDPQAWLDLRNGPSATLFSLPGKLRFGDLFCAGVTGRVAMRCSVTVVGKAGARGRRRGSRRRLPSPATVSGAPPTALGPGWS